MDFKLELIILPVTDVDRAKAFYVDQVGFHADYDQAPDEQYRIVQLTPTGSSTSVAIGVNLTRKPSAPGSVQGVRLVVADIDQARTKLIGRRVAVSDIDDRPWGRFAWFEDVDGNGWELNQPAQN